MFFMETCIDATTPSQAIEGMAAAKADERHISYGRRGLRRCATSWTTWRLRTWTSGRWTKVVSSFQELLDPTRCMGLEGPLRKRSDKPGGAGKGMRRRGSYGVAWTCADSDPRSFGRHRVLLHMFSGRRRQGDVQFFLDRMDPPTGYVLHVIWTLP